MNVTQERIVIDHNTENKIDISTQTDCWIGFTLYRGKIEAEAAIGFLEEYGTEKLILTTQSTGSAGGAESPRRDDRPGLGP